MTQLMSPSSFRSCSHGIGRLLQNPHVGFANAVRASGAVVGACLLLANALMRTRRPGIAARGTTQAANGSGKCAIRVENWRGIVWDGAYLWSICG